MLPTTTPLNLSTEASRYAQPVVLHIRHLGVTPSLALLWKPTVQTRVYARLASAARPGGVSPGSRDGSTLYHDDTLTSLEAGLRHESADRQVALDFNVFGFRWSGIQADLVGPDNLVQTVNGGRAATIGTTIGVAFHPSAAWTFEARVTGQRARLSSPDPVVADTVFARLPSVPDVAANLRALRRFALGRCDAEMELSAHYVGQSRLSFQPGLEHPAGDYVDADFGVRLARDGWQVAADVTNLTDSRANSFAFGTPYTLRSLDQRTPIRPRALTVSVRRQF